MKIALLSVLAGGAAVIGLMAVAAPQDQMPKFPKTTSFKLFSEAKCSDGLKATFIIGSVTCQQNHHAHK